MYEKIILIVCCMILLCSCSNSIQGNIIDPNFVDSSFESDDRQGKPDDGLDFLAETVELTEENIVGLWHKSSFLGAGLNDRYFFHSDNKFKLEYTQEDAAKRVNWLSGDWNLDATKLILTIREKEVVEGGVLVDGYPVSRYEIEGGTIKVVQLDAPEIIEYELSEMSIDDSGAIPRETMWIGDEQFWKYNDTAEEYGK